jgi:phosphoglycolate phosphatase
MGLCFKAVIFDFDYTLADSSEGVVECINHALSSLGFPKVSAQVARRTIGLSPSDLFIRLVGSRHKNQFDEFFRLFVAKADEIISDKTFIFESVPSVIKQLHEMNLRLGIVSNKFRYRIATILKRENLLNYFDVIVGGEDVSEYKPAPEGLIQAIETLGYSISETIYVGDTIVDAETSLRAGVSFVAVLSGVTPKEDFQGHPFIRTLENLLELPDLLSILISNT